MKGPDAFAAAERMLGERPLVRTVNFHRTPPSRSDELDRQFGLVARHFTSLNEAMLDSYCTTGEWSGPPGIVLAFYNGYRNNFDVARPLLERHDLVGWFFVVSGFVAEPVATQRDFAARNRIAQGIEGEYADGRIAMSWDEVRELDGRHVVASHTRNHAEIGHPDLRRMRNEIVGAQNDFRGALGHPVGAFAANKGAAFGEAPHADRLIEEAGYRFVFSNLKIQKLPRDAGPQAATCQAAAR